MKIRNIKGTSKNNCRCGSWYNHWKKHHPGAGIAIFCSAKGCFDDAHVGAHVVKHGSADKSWYILPLCKGHNKVNTVIDIVSYATLVPANRSRTCEQ